MRHIEMKIRRRWVSASVLAAALTILGGNAAFARELGPAFKYMGEAQSESHAVKSPGEGGMSYGDYWEVVSEVTVYRLYDKKNAAKFGRFWTLVPPTMDKQQFREDYGVCTEWNALDYDVACTLRVGTIVIIGPGQSATCKEPPLSIPASDILQVFIADPVRSCQTHW